MLRWSPYLTKKPTGWTKPTKFLGPKYQTKPSQAKYPSKSGQTKYPRKAGPVRLAPVANLRPRSIDRIDVLRPQHK